MHGEEWEEEEEYEEDQYDKYYYICESKAKDKRHSKEHTQRRDIQSNRVWVRPEQINKICGDRLRR